MSSLIKPDENNLHVELLPEMVRLSQIRANRHGVQFKLELARLVAEEEVMDLNCELELLLDSGALNQSDALAATLGVNDIVVNGRRIDVRAIDEDGDISIARALVGSQYLSFGSLVVRLSGVMGGAVVGYVSAGTWLKAEDGLRDADIIRMPYEIKSFSFLQTILELTQKAPVKLPTAAKLANLESDIDELFNNKGHLIASRQKQIFAYLCANWSDDLMAQVENIGYRLPASKVTKVLFAAGRWNASVERLTASLAARFIHLSREEIRSQIIASGERLGGEIKAPTFRQELLTALAAADLSRSSSVPAKVAHAIMAKVMSGVAAADAVKQLVKNAVAVDLAMSIKNQRQATAGFMAATADEIGMAFQQLALQPAYATHSSTDSGIDSINEALALLQATDMAETVKACDLEMSQF